MKIFKSLFISFVSVLLAGNIAFATESVGIDANTALQKLIKGNEHFVSMNLKHPDQNKLRRTELTKGQQPFAVILSCSDSRVSPEIVFDQGLGDIFVVRVAGNVLDDNVIGSIEYAVEHLGAQLIVVLGHERCGAVSAAVKGVGGNSHILCLAKAIQPAIDKAKTEKGDLIDNSIHDNVKLVVDSLKSSEPVLSEYIKNGKLSVVGAY